MGHMEYLKVQHTTLHTFWCPQVVSCVKEIIYLVEYDAKASFALWNLHFLFIICEIGTVKIFPNYTAIVSFEVTL